MTMDLVLQALSKRFGHTWANRDISLTVIPGTIVGLLGPNGAGKTTLLRQLVGLTRPTSGHIIIGGRMVVAGKQWVKETIAYLPQHPLALGDLTVEEAIHSSALLRGQSQQDANRNTERLLESFDLGPLRHRQVAGLSGGEHRLVGIASVVVAPTPVLALDEPTNELDPLMRRRVWDFIDSLRSPDRIVLLVSHNVLEAERVLDRVLIMTQGQIRHDGRPHELRGRAGDFLTVSVTASHDASRLTEEVRAVTDRLHAHPPTLEFTAPRADALTLLAGWLAEPGLISGVSVNEPSLEDAYLALRDQREENTE